MIDRKEKKIAHFGGPPSYVSSNSSPLYFDHSATKTMKKNNAKKPEIQ